ncbi:MAG: glycosyltransferase family 2 protein [Candidatus Sungbacteria bacterium]|nr:glycosyltransferase family 2 protein [Candidatus Sungbacteria bacterium]
MHLSWIIPCYNEEHRIEKTIREVADYLRTKGFDYEIIAVDNNSKDRTREVIKRLSNEIMGLRLVEASKGGKGGAVKRGMLEARGDVRIFSDADNSTSPDHFDKMEPLFQQGYDVVISSRDPKDAKGAGRDVEEPWHREIFANVGNLIIQILGVWGIWDTQNGFKGFTAKAADQIFGALTISGWAFDVEVLVLAKRLGYRVGIIPVSWRYEIDSKITLGSYVEVFRDVFRIRWNIITGKYAK